MLTDTDGTPLRRTPDGDLVPDADHPSVAAERRREVIRRCRDAARRTTDREDR